MVCGGSALRICSGCHGNQRRPATEVGVREVGDDGGSREWGSIGGRERLGRAGSGSSGPDGAVRAGLPHTGRAGCAIARPDAVVRAGSCSCHMRRAGGFVSMPHVWQLSRPKINGLFDSLMITTYISPEETCPTDTTLWRVGREETRRLVC